MSVILAVNNGQDCFRVAVDVNGKIFERQVVGQSQAHSQIALPTIATLLDECQLALVDCDAFAIGRGPGQFSALRLVCSLMATIAYTQKKPLIAVDAFAICAQAHYGDLFEQDSTHRVKCALGAHRHHVYFARGRKNQGRWHFSSPKVICVSQATAPLGEGIVYACGDGFSRYPTLLTGDDLLAPATMSSVLATLQLAKILWRQGVVTNPLDCQPLYGRKKVALTIKERATPISKLV